MALKRTWPQGAKGPSSITMWTTRDWICGSKEAIVSPKYTANTQRDIGHGRGQESRKGQKMSQWLILHQGGSQGSEVSGFSPDNMRREDSEPRLVSSASLCKMVPLKSNTMKSNLTKASLHIVVNTPHERPTWAMGASAKRKLAGSILCKGQSWFWNGSTGTEKEGEKQETKSIQEQPSASHSPHWEHYFPPIAPHKSAHSPPTAPTRPLSCSPTAAQWEWTSLPTAPTRSGPSLPTAPDPQPGSSLGQTGPPVLSVSFFSFLRCTSTGDTSMCPGIHWETKPSASDLQTPGLFKTPLTPGAARMNVAECQGEHPDLPQADQSLLFSFFFIFLHCR